MCTCEAIAETCFISIWVLISFIYLFIPTQTQTRSGFGACKGQPAPNLCNDMKIAVAALLFHGCLSAHGAHLQLTVISEPGGFRAGDQGGELALTMALFAVTLEMTDSHGCVREEKAMPGF